MKKLFGFATFGLLLLLSSHAYAGHDFMETIRQRLSLEKKEICSNGKTTVEHRFSEVLGTRFSLVLVILEPNTASRESQFYTEENKDFYSLIFYNYKMLNTKNETQILYFIKQIQSGNLKEVTASSWLQEIIAAEPNAAKSLTQQPGSDCSVIYQVPSH